MQMSKILLVIRTQETVKIHWSALSVVEYKRVHAEELRLLYGTKSLELSFTQNIRDCSFMFLRQLWLIEKYWKVLVLNTIHTKPTRLSDFKNPTKLNLGIFTKHLR